MKRKFVLTMLVAVCQSTELLAEQTAKGALTSLSRERGAEVAGQVVRVVGERGQDQPAAWRIVARDLTQPGRFREYVVQNSRVIDERFLRPEEQPEVGRAALATRRLRVDSKQAFAKADAAARKALVGFDSLDYELRNKEFSAEPVWVVRLNDQAGKVVGELAIACDSGAVLRSAWFEADRPESGAEPAIVKRGSSGGAEPSKRVSVESSSPHETGGFVKQTHAVWDRTVDGFHNGREFIHDGWRRASSSVRGVFTRWRQGGRSDEAWADGVYDSRN
jgi:hypothetical protein